MDRRYPNRRFFYQNQTPWSVIHFPLFIPTIMAASGFRNYLQLRKLRFVEPHKKCRLTSQLRLNLNPAVLYQSPPFFLRHKFFLGFPFRLFEVYIVQFPFWARVLGEEKLKKTFCQKLIERWRSRRMELDCAATRRHVAKSHTYASDIRFFKRIFSRFANFQY